MRKIDFQRIGTSAEKTKIKRPLILTALFAVTFVVFGSYFILPFASITISRPEVSEDYGVQEFLISNRTNFGSSGFEPEAGSFNVTVTVRTESTVSTESITITENIESTKSSSRHAKNGAQSLIDGSSQRNSILEIEHINKSSKNVIFIESRCSTDNVKKNYLDNKGMVLNARQCCAVESTALTNPDHEVFVFHSCPFSDDFLDHSPKFVQQLFSYPNVHIVRLNNSQVSVGSPIQQLYEKRLLEESSYPIEHSSDVLRLLLLWKFGGTYLDLDVITIKSLNELNNNWSAEEDHNSLATGVMNFEPEGEAHNMLQGMLEHINQHYDAKGWSTNGPQLLTAFVLKECNVPKLEHAERHCRINFTVYRNTIHYPVHYSRVKSLFEPSMSHQILQDIKKSFSVHFWNKLSHDLHVTVGSKQFYAILADQYCPKVYRNCGSSF